MKTMETMKKSMAMALLAGSLALAPMRGFAQSDAVEQARAHHALEQLFAALASGDKPRIERHLADAFQIIRSNGAIYDKASYVQRSVPVIQGTPRFRNIKLTRQGDIRILTFNLEVNETIEGQTVENLAPQLIVFQDLGDRWVVLASANAAKLGK